MKHRKLYFELLSSKQPEWKTSGSLVELERTVIRLGVYTVSLVLPANLQCLIVTNSVLIKLLSQSGQEGFECGHTYTETREECH